MGLTLLLLIISLALASVLLGGLLFQPAKLVVKLGINSGLGLLVLWIVNFAGAIAGFGIPLNLFTVLVTGTLGVPGLAMLTVLKVVTG